MEHNMIVTRSTEPAFNKGAAWLGVAVEKQSRRSGADGQHGLERPGQISTIGGNGSTSSSCYEDEKRGGTGGLRAAWGSGGQGVLGDDRHGEERRRAVDKTDIVADPQLLVKNGFQFPALKNLAAKLDVVAELRGNNTIQLSGNNATNCEKVALLFRSRVKEGVAVEIGAVEHDS